MSNKKSMRTTICGAAGVEYMMRIEGWRLWRKGPANPKGKEAWRLTDKVGETVLVRKAAVQRLMALGFILQVGTSNAYEINPEKNWG